jgi:hypothetical protein
MNDWDRDNLMFLLKSPVHVIRDWYAQASDDDKKYASELFEAYALELKNEAQSLLIEAQLTKNDKEFPEAREIIRKFVKNLKT